MGSSAALLLFVKLSPRGPFSRSHCRHHRCPARTEVDDKLAWRKLKNKESAARSRQLVRDRITFLEDENAGLREACVLELGPPHIGRGALDALPIFPVQHTALE